MLLLKIWAQLIKVMYNWLHNLYWILAIPSVILMVLIIINADVNGSINILRKYIKNIFSPNLEIAMDIGREQRPLKKRVA